MRLLRRLVAAYPSVPETRHCLAAALHEVRMRSAHEVCSITLARPPSAKTFERSAASVDSYAKVASLRPSSAQPLGSGVQQHPPAYLAMLAHKPWMLPRPQSAGIYTTGRPAPTPSEGTEEIVVSGQHYPQMFRPGSAGSPRVPADADGGVSWAG